MLTYLSISKPLARLTVSISSTTERDREMTVTVVFPLFLPKLAKAIEYTVTLLAERLSFFFPPDTPVYLKASMGDTFAAILPGFIQDIITVTRAKTAEIMNITGFAETMSSIPSSWPTIIGVSLPPISQPSMSPMGMPIRESSRACLLTILLSCLDVVPMVFSSP